MTRSMEIDPFWAWIPAFRVVAEHGSLSEAAATLDISRSALSRSIRLLEAAVGVELFWRSGRTLQLNRKGEQFLEAVRLGMRVVHEGYSQVRSDTPSGRLVISSSGPCLHLVQPVLGELRSRWPELAIDLCFAPPAETNSRLLRGEIDLAFLTDPRPDEAVQMELLCTLEHGIFCSSSAPLAQLPAVDATQVLEHPFVAPHKDAAPGDPWPASLPREVGLRVHQLSLAMDLCARGYFLGVFPVGAVTESVYREVLHRLPVDLVPALPAYAVRRVDVAEGMPAARLLERVRNHLNGVSSEEPSADRD